MFFNYSRLMLSNQTNSGCISPAFNCFINIPHKKEPIFALVEPVLNDNFGFLPNNPPRGFFRRNHKRRDIQ